MTATSVTHSVTPRERLADARLYLCTDARAERGDLEDFLRAALAGGVDVVQLRDKSLDTLAEMELQPLIARVANEFGALHSVNDRADIAATAGAAVFHTGQRDLPVRASRALLGHDVVLGRSSHSVEQAAGAEADSEVDYFCVGPVWSTPTKPGRSAVGPELVEQVAASNAATPWFAIGGISRDTLDDVVAAGARRAVVVRDITDADDPGAVAREIRQRLAQAAADDQATG
ncbi:MAG TPA: thiamine phosphate synthase [Jiangellaceae bacterium]|nr:thiamine phosphate synthase [Jiangellaceae bacterium]HLR96427.1 thiamine phosphate synthase [Jiangellaceae bacterium]